MISKEEKEKVIRELNSKFNQSLKCPMCGNNHFIIGDGYFNTFIQDDFKTINMGGSSIPSIPIICNKCGFMSLHALGILGLLPKDTVHADEKGEENGK